MSGPSPAGNFVVPLFSGPFPAEALKSDQDPMRVVLNNAATDEDPSFRPLEGGLRKRRCLSYLLSKLDVTP